MRALAAHPFQKTFGELLPLCSPLKFGSEVDGALHQLIAPVVEEREEGFVGDYDLELIEAQACVARQATARGAALSACSTVISTIHWRG
jgi:hypothetical protein